MQTETKRRPVGVSIIAILMWLSGVAEIISALLAVRILPALGVVDLVLGIATIAVGCGLWSLKQWSYRTAVILFIILILVDLYYLFSGSHLPIGVVVFHLIIRVLVLVYLLVDSKVRLAFR